MGGAWQVQQLVHAAHHETSGSIESFEPIPLDWMRRKVYAR
jgi:hypothetical protein